MPAAICERLMQFRSGPESLVFYACEACKPQLEAGDLSCFFARESDPVKPVDPDDEITCDLCRGQ